MSTDEQMLRDSVARFLAERYSISVRKANQECLPGFSRPLWLSFADLGLLGVALPEDVGGAGASHYAAAVVMEAFGRALVTEPYNACAISVGELVNRLAIGHQRSELLSALVTGNLIATQVYTEEAGGTYGRVKAALHSGSNGDDAEFVLSGEGTVFVRRGGVDKFIVAAHVPVAGDAGSGLTAFVVEADAQGLSGVDVRMLDGSFISKIRFDGVRVGPSALLGRPGSANLAIEFTLDMLLLGLCAEAIGIMDGVLWQTRDHLNARRQYGTRLGGLQALQHRMADMFVEVELSRSLCLRALSVLASNPPDDRRKLAVTAFRHACRSGDMVCKNGIQLHGAMGMSDEYSVGQYFKRMAVISRLPLDLERYFSTHVVNADW